jgi:prepilin-type processing-associated H-X9-DG protein
MATCPSCQATLQGLPLTCPSCGAEVPLWVARGEDIYGPYHLADLHRAQAEGRLSAEDRVSVGDEGEWQPIQALLSTDKAAPQAPPPPPVPWPATTPRPPVRGQRNVTSLVVLIGVGFVLLFVLPILAAIVFPVFAKSREKARQAACMSNLKVLSVAMLQYTADNDGRLPVVYGMRDFGARRVIPKQQGLDLKRDFPPGNWRLDLYPYARNLESFVCPTTRYSYQFNHTLYGTSMAEIARPAEIPSVYDHGWILSYSPPPHNYGYNVGYVDGHVRWRSRGERPRQWIDPPRTR